MLNSTVANRIVAKLSPLIPEVKVVNLSGEILARGSSEKLGGVRRGLKRSIPLIYKGKKIGFIVISGITQKTKRLTSFVREISEILIHQGSLLEKIEREEERKDKFIYDFLNSPHIDEDYFLEEAKVLGIELNSFKTLILLKILEPPLNNGDFEGKFKITRIKKGMIRILNSFYTKSKDNYVAYTGENTFIIIKDLRNNEKPEVSFEIFKKTLNHFYNLLKSELKIDLALGVGSFHPGIIGLRKTFKEAKLAYKIGSYFGESGIFKISELGTVVPLFLGLSKETLTFSEKAISKLSSFKNQLSTLETFFGSNMNLTLTSKKLRIHRNTLVYRLNRIAEKLELDPRNFEDAYKIMLLIFYDRLSGNSFLKDSSKVIISKESK